MGFKIQVIVKGTMVLAILVIVALTIQSYSATNLMLCDTSSSVEYLTYRGWFYVMPDYFASLPNHQAVRWRWGRSQGPPSSTTMAIPLWPVVLGLLAVSAYPVLLPRYIRWRRNRRGLCPCCAYDLYGNSSGCCPECGTISSGRCGRNRNEDATS